jgi:hypothetical protein
VHDAVDQGGGGTGAERPVPRGGEHQHRAEAEHVAGRANLTALGLFGGHEPRRADDQAGVGQRARLRGPGDAEVDDSRPVVGQQHVGGLEVTVDHAGRVDRGQALGQPGGQHQDRGRGERAVRRHRVGQRRAGHVGGGQPRRRAVQVGVDQRRRIQAADLSRRVDFAPEPGPELAVSGQVGPDDLDRDRPSTRRPAQEHPPHAAAAQPTDHPVRPDPLGIPRLQFFGYAHPSRLAALYPAEQQPQARQRDREHR